MGGVGSRSARAPAPAMAAEEEGEAEVEEGEMEGDRDEEALLRKSGSKRLVRRNGPRWLTTMLFSMPRTDAGFPGIIPSRRLEHSIAVN